MGDEVDQKLKLYIRLPFKIEDPLQVRDLHPDITQVYLPRQKSAKWCIVSFANKETLETANSELQGKIINGKKLFCRPFKKGKKVKVPKEKVKKSEKKTEVRPEPAESLLDLIK